MPSEFAIETTGLEKIYRSRWRPEVKAVSNISLRVPRGKKFGLLGANGAGKTTFVKMLLSAVMPTAGSAKIFGRDVRLNEARQPVGYLPENHRFPTYFTGAGMLDFYAALSGMRSRDRKLRVAELLSLVGLSDWGAVRIRKYSKGMLQRLGLAQALMHNPELLILDEPTDGVDPVGRLDIRDILNRLRDTGVTVFINSHLLGEVEAFCDYVTILKRGEIALEGSVADLTAGRGYRITVTGLDEVLKERLGAQATPAGSGFEIRTSTREEANALVDQLRAGGETIESLGPCNSSLEEVFIRVTSSERAE